MVISRTVRSRPLCCHEKELVLRWRVKTCRSDRKSRGRSAKNTLGLASAVTEDVFGFGHLRNLPAANCLHFNVK